MPRIINHKLRQVINIQPKKMRRLLTKPVTTLLKRLTLNMRRRRITINNPNLSRNNLHSIYGFIQQPNTQARATTVSFMNTRGLISHQYMVTISLLLTNRISILRIRSSLFTKINFHRPSSLLRSNNRPGQSRNILRISKGLNYNLLNRLLTHLLDDRSLIIQRPRTRIRMPSTTIRLADRILTLHLHRSTYATQINLHYSNLHLIDTHSHNRFTHTFNISLRHSKVINPQSRSLNRFHIQALYVRLTRPIQNKQSSNRNDDRRGRRIGLTNKNYQ